MSDEIRSNLEPIEASDLDLKKKFAGESSETKKSPGEGITVPETAPIPETAPERKEGAVEKESSYSKILSKVKTPPAVHHDEDSIAADAEKISQDQDVESRITNLIKIAQNKGVVHAVKVARHLEDNYALDEFHDRLLGDELHDALVAKGMIKEL